MPLLVGATCCMLADCQSFCNNRSLHKLKKQTKTKQARSGGCTKFRFANCCVERRYTLAINTEPNDGAHQKKIPFPSWLLGFMSCLFAACMFLRDTSFLSALQGIGIIPMNHPLVSLEGAHRTIKLTIGLATPFCSRQKEPKHSFH